MAKQPHIAVLKGGWSAEREISLQSGAAAAKALRAQNYEVSEWDIGRASLAKLAEAKPDIAFNALHGSGGEDGQMQGVLECLQLPYTHSGVLASALAMDKPRAKKLFAQAGLPVLPEILCADIRTLTEHPMTPPYVVKPSQEGSSIDVVIIQKDDPPPATHYADNALSARQAQRLGGWMIESYVAGAELSCAVMDGKPLDVVELVPKQGFYDYANKYEDGRTEHILPARLSAKLLEQIKQHSATAHQVLGCRGISRVDFRYDADTETLALLELNTQPGLTPLSLVPEIAAAHSIDFPSLIKWLVEDASCFR